MSNEEMFASLDKATNIMNGDISEDSDYDKDKEEFMEESNKYGADLRYKVGEKLKQTIANVIFVQESECLSNYKTYEVYEPLANKFKYAIENKCNTHKIIIK